VILRRVVATAALSLVASCAGRRPIFTEPAACSAEVSWRGDTGPSEESVAFTFRNTSTDARAGAIRRVVVSFASGLSWRAWVQPAGWRADPELCMGSWDRTPLLCGIAYDAEGAGVRPGEIASGFRVALLPGHPGQPSSWRAVLAGCTARGQVAR
jgi:hypothetical protein